MRIDLRRFTDARTPKCDTNGCRNRSNISVGEATSRSGLGRHTLCDECARQLAEVLTDYATNNMPMTSIPKVEATPDPAPASMIEAEDTSALPEPEADTPLVQLTRAELMKLAKEKDIKFSATIKTDELRSLVESLS